MVGSVGIEPTIPEGTRGYSPLQHSNSGENPLINLQEEVFRCWLFQIINPPLQNLVSLPRVELGSAPWKDADLTYRNLQGHETVCNN